MIESFTGEHGGFILGSWLAAVLIIGALLAWVLIDGRKVRRDLAALEAAGFRRRSADGENDGGTDGGAPTP
ncbi:MAG: heme exporter protein CcmD [Pseudomonadota bacterium]